MNIRAVVAANLRKYRKDKRLSQEALADEAGVDRTYVSSIERRVYAVSVDKLALFADALGVEPYRLLMPPRRG